MKLLTPIQSELSVTESRLSSAFDDTCRAWQAREVLCPCPEYLTLPQARFQVAYMQCGCPIPDDTSVHRFVRLFRHYICGRSQLQVELHPEHLPATHPSTHNALLTSQTVGTGTFGKVHHHVNGKRKDANERLRSPTRHTCKRSNRTTQLHLDLRMSPAHSPTHFEKILSALPSPSFSLRGSGFVG